jgi:hypothetical protein
MPTEKEFKLSLSDLLSVGDRLISKPVNNLKGITTEKSIGRILEQSDCEFFIQNGIMIPIVDEAMPKTMYAPTTVVNNLATLAIFDEWIKPDMDDASKDQATRQIPIEINLLRPVAITERKPTISDTMLVNMVVKKIGDHFTANEYIEVQKTSIKDVDKAKVHGTGVVTEVHDFQKERVPYAIHDKESDFTFAEKIGSLRAAVAFNLNLMDHGTFWYDQASLIRLDSYLLRRDDEGHVQLFLCDFDVMPIEGRKEESYLHRLAILDPQTNILENTYPGMPISDFRLDTFYKQFRPPSAESDQSLSSLIALLDQSKILNDPKYSLELGLAVLSTLEPALMRMQADNISPELQVKFISDYVDLNRDRLVNRLESQSEILLPPVEQPKDEHLVKQELIGEVLTVEEGIRMVDWDATDPIGDLATKMVNSPIGEFTYAEVISLIEKTFPQWKLDSSISSNEETMAAKEKLDELEGNMTHITNDNEFRITRARCMKLLLTTWLKNHHSEI